MKKKANRMLTFNNKSIHKQLEENSILDYANPKMTKSYFDAFVYDCLYPQNKGTMESYQVGWAALFAFGGNRGTNTNGL